MASLNLNNFIKKTQQRTLVVAVIVMLVVGIAFLTLVSGEKKKSPARKTSEPAFAEVVDESFSHANTESALSAEHVELEFLKQQMEDLKKMFEKESQDHQSEINQLKRIAQEKPVNPPTRNETTHLFPSRPLKVNALTFHYQKHHASSRHARLTPNHYVPSGTFVTAVILGGADADASVNGQSKNNGVMLFKLLQSGTLPNGQQSHLKGCFVTASSYGDISSERAYVILDKLSCAEPGQPIIDKTVTGWAFFGGKVGIKGLPLMRDNKVMQWAGISGAMSGIASAAQYSQSVQSISPLGTASSVPSANIVPYAGYGGISKAADVLSNYYVKRAEQYHPVIQVGAGNFVTIVFKDGFYLEPDEALVAKGKHREEDANENTDEPNFEVPREVLQKIDKHYEDQPMNEVSS